MKTKFSQTAAILVSASLMFSAPVLLAVDSDSPGQVSSANDLTYTDTALFLEAANNINRTEIEMGRLAHERGQSESIRQLGERTVRDHDALENKLKALAADKGIVLPKLLDARHQKMIDELASYSRADFDRFYVDDQVTGHKHAISLFQQAAAENQDRSVRQFAASAVPILQQHLNWAQKALGAINEPAGAAQ